MPSAYVLFLFDTFIFFILDHRARVVLTQQKGEKIVRCCILSVLQQTVFKASQDTQSLLRLKQI